MTRRLGFPRLLLSGCRLLLIGSLAAALAEPLAAEQDPNHARGFSPGEVYDVSGIDSVNLFNGNLTLVLPIGPRYPLGDGFSYGLVLSYNSQVWDFETRTDNQGAYVQALPRRSSNAGLGWRLSLGGTLFGPRHLANTKSRWRFESEDGADHMLFRSLHVGESSSCWFTRDGSYLRLCPDAGGLWRLEFPDGTSRTFAPVPYTEGGSPPWDKERYRLRSIEDRFGHRVDVAYGGGGLSWTITDTVGRSHTVELAADTIDGHPYPMVERVRLEAFGGTEALYTLSRALRLIDRSCKHTDTTMYPATVSVPLLTRLDLPAGAGSYDLSHPLAYNQQANAPCLVEDLPGTLRRLQLPTGGLMEWTYQEYAFLARSDPPTQESLVLRTATGVRTKRTLAGDGTCEHGALPKCTWTYSWGSEVANRWTTVRTPLGDETVSHFRQQWISLNPQAGYQGWDYGLPYTDAVTTLAEDGSELYLSREVFDGTASGQPERQIFVAYERDRLKPSANREYYRDWHDANRRTAIERTLYLDDLYGPQGARVPRFREVAREDFDGVGHYRRQRTWGDFHTAGSPDTRLEVTRYNRFRGTYDIDPLTNTPAPEHTYSPWPDGNSWVLGTYDRRRASESGSTVEARFCFDEDTGRLRLERHLANGSTPGGNDVIVRYTRDPATWLDPGTQSQLPALRYREAYFGGDAQTVPAEGDPCAVESELPWPPAYRLEHFDTHGAPAATRYLRENGTPMGFLVVDRTIDPATGLAAVSRDPAGLATDYDHDRLGRLVAIEPRAGGDAWTQIAYRTATASEPARVNVFRWPNGSQSGPVLAQSRYFYDPFGRLTRDDVDVPGQGWTTVKTTYNALGWKTAVSERGPVGSPPGWTDFLEHDPFGRPRRVELPDFPADARHWVELGYNGVRLASREVSIGSSLAGDEVRSVTAEIYDIEGRLFRVKEAPTPTSNEINTNYSYDAAGRLTRVSVAGQVRLFDYDGRGFLLSESHPERTTHYSEYDALGKAGRQRSGDQGGPWDLSYEHDDAGRLVAIREHGSGDELKAFVYGDGTTATDRSNGKIVTATRHNRVPNPLNEAPLDVVVTETYAYGGVGGRVSSRGTELETQQSWTQGWRYDDLGQITEIDYPECTYPAICGSDTRPRTVDQEHTLGFLTAVAGYADAIDYHANGMLATIEHSNGVTYGQGFDPFGKRRPGSLWIVHPTLAVSFLAGDPNPPGTPLAYAYDGAGNVTAWGDERYRYDGLSRLLEAQMGEGETQGYAFDPYGNLVAKTTDLGGGEVTYTYAVESQTNQLSGAVYDDAGNQTTWGSFDYDFDAFGMMWRLRGNGNHSTYIYTADDERIWTVDSTVSPWRETFTLRNLDGKVLRTFYTDDEFLKARWQQDYVYRDGQLMATAVAEGSGEITRHLHVNHLGTPILITDATGAVEARHFYFPFGEEITPLTDDERMKFTGHERDLNQAGSITDDLDYMHARYCSPVTGRFLSVDPASSKTVGESQKWNRYSYVGNNPLKFVDPDGELKIRAIPNSLGSTYTLDFETSGLMIRIEHYSQEIPNRLFPRRIRKLKSPLEGAKAIDEKLKGAPIETHDTLEGKLAHADFEAAVRDEFIGPGSALSQEFRESGFFLSEDLGRLQSVVREVANDLYNSGDISIEERNQLIATYDIDRLRKKADEAARRAQEELLKRERRQKK